jgi:hypothetical protein
MTSFRIKSRCFAAYPLSHTPDQLRGGLEKGKIRPSAGSLPNTLFGLVSFTLVTTCQSLSGSQFKFFGARLAMEAALEVLPSLLHPCWILLRACILCFYNFPVCLVFLLGGNSRL